MLVLRATRDVNLSGDVVLVPGADYTVTFTARGTDGRDLIAGIGDAGGNYFNDTETLSMTDGWQTYTLHLNASDGVHGGLFSGASRVFLTWVQMLVRSILTT